MYVPIKNEEINTSILSCISTSSNICSTLSLTNINPINANIEDRIWGQTIIDNGFKILYEPSASVYHYHGIHQDSNQERLINIVNIIEKNTNIRCFEKKK